MTGLSHGFLSVSLYATGRIGDGDDQLTAVLTFVSSSSVAVMIWSVIIVELILAVALFLSSGLQGMNHVCDGSAFSCRYRRGDGY